MGSLVDGRRRWLARLFASMILSAPGVAAAAEPLRPAGEPGAGGLPPLPRDFALQQSPWVDLSFTNFWMGSRTGNFLNLGVQVGGYFADRLRLTARLVAPLETTDDSYSAYADVPQLSSYTAIDSRSVAVLYGASLGLILLSSRSFVFAPGVLVWRTDVNDYGTTGALSIPFDWTTRRGLRVGFEFAIGHSFGGEALRQCLVTPGSSMTCGVDTVDRPGGTAVLLQFQLGSSLAD